MDASISDIDLFKGVAQDLIKRCQNLQHINGIKKLEKKCRTELNFFESLRSRELRVQESQLKSSNLSHYAGIICTVEILPGVTRILHPYRLAGRNSLVVDVVAGQGQMWIKVIARKAQAMYLLWAGHGQFGDKDILSQSLEYVQCAKEHPLNYQTPRLGFFFYNAVTQPIAEELQDLGITVYGQVVSVNPDIQRKLDAFEDSDSDSTSEPSTDTISDCDQALEDSEFVASDIPTTIASSVSLSSSTLAESSRTSWLPDVEADVNITSDLHRIHVSKNSSQDSNAYHDLGKRDHISKLVCIHCGNTSLDVNVRSDNTSSPCEGTRSQSEAAVASDSSSCNDEHGNAICLCNKMVCPENTHTSKQKTEKCGFSCPGQDACSTILVAAEDSERDLDAESPTADMVWTGTGVNKQNCDLKNNPFIIMNIDSSVISFYQAVSDTLKLDCSVQSICDAALFECSPVSGDGSQADAGELCSEPMSAITKVNLDITSLITLVSSVCHGGSNLVFQEAILTLQAEEERRTPVVPRLLQFMEDKQLYVCESALRDFHTILRMLGGEREKRRAADLLQKLTVVPDQLSARAMHLPVSGKIKERSKTIFGTGDMLEAVTITANSGFVRAAENQGISFAVFLHESRALTEKKEQFAKPIPPCIGK